MRVANKTLYDGVMRNLTRTSVELNEANQIVSSGKNISNLSDDPVGMVSVLDLRSSLSGLEQMDRNLSVGRSWLNSAESALSQTENILSAAKELTVQMSNATKSAAERKNAVNMVDGYLKQIISLADTNVGGRYIFGGTNTGTAPFSLNDSETVVEYNGNDTPFSIRIGKDTNIPIGRDGKDIFGKEWDESNIFKTLIDLKNHLETNDVSEIQNTMTKLDDHMMTIRASISDIAGKSIHIDIKEQIIRDLELTYTDRMSRIEDADIAEAVINLKAKELAYNASLNSASKMMQLSLVNYV